MKKILLMMLPLLPLAAAARQGYVVKGTIPAAASAEKATAYLYYENGKGENVFDSAAVKNGAFEFHGDIDQARKGALFLAYQPVKFKYFMEVLLKVRAEEDFKNATLDVLNLYVEPGTVSVTSKDSLYKASVSGSVLNTDLSVLNQQRAPVFAAMKFAIARFNDLAQSGSYEDNDIIQLEADYRKGLASLKDLELGYVKAHKNSPVSLALLNKYIGSESANTVTGPLFAGLTPALRSTPEGKALDAQIADYKKTDIGAMAPDFAQPDSAGNMISLSSFRGQYVLLDFWASWCGPCRSEIPGVLMLYKQYQPRNFKIVAVSLDKAVVREKWLQAIADDHTGIWTQLSDLKGGDNAAAKLYHVSNIPQNFLISPEGKILARNLHGDALPAALAQYVR